MTTAQDQPSRAEPATFEVWWAEEGQFCRAGGGDYEKTFAHRAWQAARALPAGMEPVAWIDVQAWPPIRWPAGSVRADFGAIDGKALYTAAQVLAMLDAGIAGNRLPPGWKLTEDMHIAAVKVLHRATGVDGLPQRMVDAMIAAAPRPPAAQEQGLLQQFLQAAKEAGVERLNIPVECWCESCDMDKNWLTGRTRMALCPQCGNKRCPRATHHDNACTGSNEPGQRGSNWEHVQPSSASKPTP